MEQIWGTSWSEYKITTSLLYDSKQDFFFYELEHPAGKHSSRIDVNLSIKILEQDTISDR